MREAINNKEKEYFLGSIVVTSTEGNRLEVVDGQQRLTTISLIILAIKEIFRIDEDLEVVMSLQSDFLASTDRRTKEREPKLILNEVDNELFQDLIEDYDSAKNRKLRRQSHQRLMNAANHCFEYFSNLCENSKDSEDELHTWLDYIETALKIIVVVAPDDSNAFIIFETLNDRGLELAISDLVKNYLFHRSLEKIEETKNRWLSMVSTLESASDDPLVVTYIRHFSMAKYGLVREKDLFSLLKRKITSKRGALRFSTELSETVRIYSALINTDHEYWADFPSDAKTSVATINLLGMTQIRPLLLSILANFPANSVSETFKKLVSVAVRYQLVGGVGGGSLERLYSETAKSVSERNVTSASQVISALKTVPSDNAFKAAFRIASISKQKLARFYLRELEIASTSINSETVPDIDPNKVNLEHILPANPSNEWNSEFTGEDFRSHYNRLGNLAIMASRINSSIGNNAFSSKRNAYKDSTFHFTKMIYTEIEWTKQSIEKRQKAMAEVAVMHWAL